MNMTDLIAIPLKKSSDIDLEKPFTNVISGIYSTADSQVNFSASIKQLNELRRQTLAKSLDRSYEGLEVLYRYYDQISALEGKIPPAEVNIPFKWKDAFDRGSLFGGRINMTVSSLGYEKVCVLFNIAAMQSQIAANTNITDGDDVLKTSAKILQQSSGIFSHLRNAASTMCGQQPTPDLHQDTVLALSTLMLAQAQEIFIVKAIQDKMKDGIIAKLCMQAEECYSEALKQLNKDSVKHIWEREWITTVSGKHLAYEGLANFFQSQVCSAKKTVGEQIARLNLCLELLNKAQQRSGNPSLYSDYHGKATRLLADAKKDNDFIYHERVPETSSLAPVEKVPSARLAKTLPVPERFSSNFRDLFDELIPVALHQAMVQCNVRKSEMTNSKIAQLREATQTLNSILSSLNLPAAIEDVESGSDLPESLKEKCKEVMDAGGLKTLQKELEENDQLHKVNFDILNECEKMLKEEEEADNQLRDQLKTKWTRTPSNKLNRTLFDAVNKYSELLRKGTEADLVVKEKLQQHTEAIRLLESGENSLVEKLPKSSPSSCTTSTEAKQKLKELMVEVDELKRGREHLEEELKNVSFDIKTPFLNALAQDGAINEPALSVELLGKEMKNVDAKVQASIENQENVVPRILQYSDEYFGTGSNTTTMSKRDTMIRDLSDSYDCFKEVTSLLKEGTFFYKGLTELLVTFQNRASDYCFARKTEKDELLKDVYRDASQAVEKLPPPRRPPPPSFAGSSSSTPTTTTTASAPPAASAAPNPYAGAPGPIPNATPQPQWQLPYPAQPYVPAMPMPYQSSTAPYPPMAPGYAPMPTTFNPYATYPPPTSYQVHSGFYQNQNPQQPPPQQ